MNLPETFLQHMRTLLGEEYDAWLCAMEEQPFSGLRINNRKLDRARWDAVCPQEYRGDRVPWTENGYYYSWHVRPALDPYYYAGLYYLQEPSAMAPAALFDIRPGEKILDLCAAPGGKSTELGVKLGGTGLLVSNDISNSRAKALLRNLELFGIGNLLVTSETPEKLADTFGPYFDKILVDAPCSGEGMFRKNPDLIKSWEERGPEYYAPLQRQILSAAVRMLKPGGYLMYSTCTFAKTEDEDTIHAILETFPEMKLSELPLFQGAQRGMDGEPVIRLFPHHIKGEGHFLALLHKDPSAVQENTAEQKYSDNAVSPQVKQMLKESDFTMWEDLFSEPFDHSRIMVKEDCVYLLPEDFHPEWKLRYLRTGLLLGTCKKNRFAPSQAMAMAVQPEKYKQSFSLRREDERVIRYLKGESVFLQEDEVLPKGWILICVDGFPLGWAKNTGIMLKNKYYAGWRWQA